MRYLFFILLICVVASSAAGVGIAGRYTGEWKSDSSGNNGAVHITIASGANDTLTGEASFTITGQEVKTVVESVKFSGAQLEMTYTFEIQGAALRTKHTGTWDGKILNGRYVTTLISSGEGVDAGTWNASPAK